MNSTHITIPEVKLTIDQLLKAVRQLDDASRIQLARVLMETEMDQQASLDRDHLITFREQLYWILFLEIHTMLTTPSYPPRLLKRAQMETNSFLQGWQQHSTTDAICSSG